jgi:hypothetical protein
LITQGRFSIQEVIDYIWKYYPERAKAKNICRGTPGTLYPENGVYTGDNSKSRQALGLEYRPLERMLEDAFETFVNLEKQLV